MKRSLVIVTPALRSDLPPILGLTLIASAPTVDEHTWDCADEECRDPKNLIKAEHESAGLSDDEDEHEVLEELIEGYMNWSRQSLMLKRAARSPWGGPGGED